MFIPAGVGLITAWDALSAVILPVSIVTVVTIFTVMLVTGHAAQFVIKIGRKNEK